MTTIQFRLRSLFLYFITILFQLHFTTSKPVAFSLKLIPWDSPDSPFYPRNLTQLQRVQRTIELSRTRANYLASFSTHSGMMNPTNIQLPINPYSYYMCHVTKIRIGTPSTEITLIVDTASHLLWTQCEPCHSCFAQKSKIYDSRTSKTYKKLSCKHPICRNLGECIKGECVYQTTYNYPRGSRSTKGIASSETLAMPIKNNVTYQLFQTMIFGCSNDNRGWFLPNDNTVSGYLGLNRKPSSFISQVRDMVKGRFSYCLHGGSGYLKFGEDIVMQGGAVKTTPFIYSKLDFYYLNLTGISVASQRLKLPWVSFSLITSGCLIGSGIKYSVIYQKAYDKVIRAFADYYKGKLERVDSKIDGLDLNLCYKYNETFRDYGSMTFHFQGADYLTKKTYIHILGKQGKLTCVALLSGPNTTILGEIQQWDTRFVFDINANKLQFMHEDCRKDKG